MFLFPAVSPLLGADADEPVIEEIPPPPPGLQPVTVSAEAAGTAPQGPSSPAGSVAAPLPAPSAPAPGAALAPTAPSFLTATAENRLVHLGWYPSEGSRPISGYHIFRGTDPAAISADPLNKVPVTEASYDDSDLNSKRPPLNRHTYFYRVRAFDVDGRVSPYSTTVSASPNGPLLAPGKVEAEEKDGKILLRWTEPISTGAFDLSGFQLYRSDKSGQSGELLAFLPAQARGYDDSQAANGRAYYYTLRSQDLAGALSEASPELRAVAYKPASAPTGLSALGVGDASVRLKWEPPASQGTFKVKGYNIYRATSSPVDVGARPINKALVSGKTRFEDGEEDSLEAPKKGTDYHYVVVAVDEEGKPSPPSAEGVAGPVASLTGLSTGEFEVVSGSTLQIRGRKTIDMSNTWTFRSPESKYQNQSASTPEVKQGLQVQLTGKVGRKIKVDVDYNDSPTLAPGDQQHISVVYTGDQAEVFKEFAFGDILMDLSSSRTEFAGYNKSLFGAKMKLESPDSRLKLTAIGAQTKGYTETKRVVGGYEQVKTGTSLGINIPDTSFVRNKYYFLSRDPDLVEGGDYIEPGSVQVFFDRPNGTNPPYNLSAVQATASDGNPIYFLPLNPTADFTVDAATGLLIFTFAGYYPGPNDNIVVAYRRRRADGTLAEVVGYNPDGSFDFSSAGLDSDVVGGKSGSLAGGRHMIQFPRRYAGQYDGHMSFQFYNLGNQNILNPQRDPEFKLVVYGTGQTPIYQVTGQNDFSNVLEFDTRLGTMRFRVPFPFKEGTSSANDFQIDPPVYSALTKPMEPNKQDAYNVSAISNYTVHLEYKYKLSSYSLRFNIIRGSEHITLDGRRLTRDVDYFLDYETGQLIFSNPEQIQEYSVIEATYEYLPFGGQFTSTIFGTRGEYQITKDLSLGSTFLWNSSDAPQEVPDARSTPYSLQILDGDIQAAFPQEALDALARLIPGSGGRSPLKVRASAEAAHSWHRVNTYSRNNESGVAMLDAFESLDESIATSLDENTWFPASLPSAAPGGQSLLYNDRRFSKFVNVLEEGHDSRQRADAGDNPKRTLILLKYSGFNSTDNWDAFVYSLGVAPEPRMKEATYLELWVKVDNDVRLNLDVGTVDEDANANRASSASPDTESPTGSINSQTDQGILNFQTVGSPYPHPDVDASRYEDKNYWGRGNNSLDTEDLNANNILDRPENLYRFSLDLRRADGQASLNGFQRVLIPLTAAQMVGSGLSVVPGNADYYRTVQAVRLWFTRAPGAAPAGEIKIESLQFKINKWQVRADPNATSLGGLSVTANNDKIQVTGVNRIVAPQVAKGFDYPPNLNFFRKETSKADDREQSMQLEYGFTSLDQSSGRPHLHVRRELSRSGDVDLGYYDKLRLDLYKPHETLPGEILLIRLGFDDSNYFEYQVLLDQIGVGSWQSVSLALDGSDGRRRQVGSPYLRRVKYAYVTVLTTNNVLNPDPRLADKMQREILWLDNLRVTDAQAREGTAYRVSVNYDLFGGKVTLTEDIREVESDFTKVDEQNNDPRRRERSHSLSGGVNFIPGVPVTMKVEDRQYFTELKRREDPKYSRNFQDPDETLKRYNASLGFNLVPKLTLSSNASYETSRKTYLPTYIQSQRLLQPPDDRAFVPDSTRTNMLVYNQAQLTMPDWALPLKGDQLRGELSYKNDANYIDVPSRRKENLSFRSSAREDRTLKGRYTGQFKWPGVLTMSPSFGYTWVEARGDIPVSGARNPYYRVSVGEGVQDYTPQSREINPQLGFQFESMPFLKSPRLTYNFTQTRDFVRNDLRTPGSLDLSTELDFGDPLGVKDGSIPKFTFSQNWSVDSTLNNDERIRNAYSTQVLNRWLDENRDFKGRYNSGNQPLQSYPNMALADQDRFKLFGMLDSGLDNPGLWWVRVEDLGLGEDTREAFHVENTASNAYRKSTTNLSTRLSMTLLPGWKADYSPRVNWIEDRSMAAPEQVSLRKQFGAGVAVNFPEPNIFRETLKPQGLTLNYDYNTADTFTVTQEIAAEKQQLIRSSNANSIQFTLPTKPTEALSVNFGYRWSGATESNFAGQASTKTEVQRASHDPSLGLVYLLRFDKPFKFWDIWPFYGRELRIRQNIEINSGVTASYRRDVYSPKTVDIPNARTDTYNWLSTIGYRFLDNVLTKLLYEYRSFSDEVEPTHNNYQSHRVGLNLEATF